MLGGSVPAIKATSSMIQQVSTVHPFSFNVFIFKYSARGLVLLIDNFINGYFYFLDNIPVAWNHSKILQKVQQPGIAVGV